MSNACGNGYALHSSAAEEGAVCDTRYGKSVVLLGNDYVGSGLFANEGDRVFRTALVELVVEAVWQLGIQNLFDIYNLLYFLFLFVKEIND